MNRKEFGQLIASIRHDLNLTQAQLAEEAELEPATLSNIERGAKSHLEPETLFRLANALHLTSLERREFLLGACGLDHEKIVRQPAPNSKTDAFDSQKTIASHLSMMEKIHLPCHLGDCYGDILAVNLATLDVFQVDIETIKSLTYFLGGFNNLHYMYGTLLGKLTFKDDYSQSAVNAIRAFREGSLRYRSKPRYQALMKEFMDKERYPLFERYWRRASTEDEDKEGMREIIESQHPKYGTLLLMSNSSITMTPYGELFLTCFLPMNAHTAESLLRIMSDCGPGTVQLLSWPDKQSIS